MSLKPGYKQTEIGVIPDDWEAVRLGDLVSEPITDGPHLTPKFYNDGVPFLSVNNIVDGKILWNDLRYISREDDRIFSVKCKPKRGDILFGKAASVGKIALVDADIDFNVWSPLAVIRCSASLSPQFVHFALQSSRASRQIVLLTNSSSQGNIGMTDIAQIEILLPPPKEQKAIADALSDVDALINSLEALLIKKRNIKTGVMQELLTGRTRLPGFSDDWQIRKLKDVAELLSGGTPSTAVAAYWGGGIPWCTPTDITSTKGNFITSTEQTITTEGVKSSSATILPVGSILLCTRATIGEAKITTVAMTTNQGFKSLVVRAGVSNIFMYFLMSTKKRVLLERSSGSTFLEISKKELGSIDLWMPDLAEQKAIAAVLSDIDDEIEALEKRLAKTRDLKQGMAQELLTGRTRLV